MIDSLDEIFLILLWIVPGYYAHLFVRYLGVDVKKYSEFENIIWALSYSLIGYAIIFNFSDYKSFEQLQADLFNPWVISMIWFVPAVFGILIGLLVRRTRNNKSKFGDCWIIFQDKLKSKKPAITVFTKDGQEIEGILNVAGKEEVEKEIIITNPIRIIRNESHEPVVKITLGMEMLITDDNIARISFWEHF